MEGQLIHSDSAERNQTGRGESSGWVFSHTPGQDIVKLAKWHRATVVWGNDVHLDCIALMLRILPSGPRAFLVEVENDSQVLSLLNEVANRATTSWIKHVVDIVPGERTVLFDGVADLNAAQADVQSWQLQVGQAGPGMTVEVECRYDGPDLDRVAELWQMSSEDVVNYHSRLLHRVVFCGFAPGFAYIRSLDENHMVPRRASPRPNVAAGSVGLARSYTGIYPRPSPGGWQLIGRSDTRIWDEKREPPALLTPGTRVTFIPI